MGISLLLVEDDTGLGTLMSEYLSGEGFSVQWVQDGLRAERVILESHPDLVVLDLMLPGQGGLEVCRAVRPHYDGPILMLTARGDEVDQVLGLELGADDYVPKPISPRLLLARIRALLRRPGTRVGATRVVDGDLCIDQARRELRLGDTVLELTTAEFDLLWALARRQGQALSRQDLFQELRGIDYDGIDRSMDVRVSQLRRKLLLLTGGDLIRTVRGVGYQYAGMEA